MHPLSSYHLATPIPCPSPQTQFFLIVIYRVLYLCPYGPLRLLYHHLTIALNLGYLMHLYWAASLLASHYTIRLFLALKAAAFTLSALQLRYGPPGPVSRSARFLTRRVTTLRWRAFQVYRALPFLYELQTILDWCCTATTLTLYDWLKVGHGMTVLLCSAASRHKRV